MWRMSSHNILWAEKHSHSPFVQHYKVDRKYRNIEEQRQQDESDNTSQEMLCDVHLAPENRSERRVRRLNCWNSGLTCHQYWFPVQFSERSCLPVRGAGFPEVPRGPRLCSVPPAGWQTAPQTSPPTPQQGLHRSVPATATRVRWKAWKQATVLYNQ